MTTTQLQREIASQPDVVARLLAAHDRAVPRLLDRLPPFDTIVIAGRGSSHHAGVYAQYALGALTGIPVVFAPPSLSTLYQAVPRWPRALLLAVSQGGGSPDTLEVVQTARHLGRPAIAITNTPDSPLADAADHVIALGAGEERSLAATKTYTATLTAIALITATLAGDSRLRRDLDRLPDQMSAQLAASDTANRLAANNADTDAWTLLGRGYNLATALEGALKLTELTGAQATGHSAADYLHGPVAGAGRHTRAIIIAADDPPTHASLQHAAAELAARQAEISVVNVTTLPYGKTRLALTPHVPAWLSPVCAVIPLQQLALALAQARGLDPDRPAGLHKITQTT